MYLRKSLLLLIVLVANGDLSFAQLRLGLKAGASYSNIVYNEDYKSFQSNSKISPLVGVVLQFPLSEKVLLNSEIFYTVKGSKLSNSRLPYGEFNLNYVNVPVLLHYMINERFHLAFGPELGFLLKASTANFNVSDNFKNVAIGVASGLGYSFNQKVMISFRYIEGVRKLQQGLFGKINSETTNGFDVIGRNRVLQLAINYNI